MSSGSAGAGVHHGAGIAPRPELFREPVAEAAVVREDQPAPAPGQVAKPTSAVAIGGFHPPDDGCGRHW